MGEEVAHHLKCEPSPPPGIIKRRGFRDPFERSLDAHRLGGGGGENGRVKGVLMRPCECVWVGGWMGVSALQPKINGSLTTLVSFRQNRSTFEINNKKKRNVIFFSNFVFFWLQPKNAG